MSGWKPIAAGPLAAALRAAVDDIVAAVGTLSPTLVPAGLSDGKAGLALFCAYAGVDGADDWLGAAVDDVAERALALDFGSGIVGVAWAMAHLSRRAGAEADIDADLDAALRDAVVGWEGSYDLVLGLAGIATYAIERMPSDDAAAILRGIVARLDALAVPLADGIGWHTPRRLLPPHLAEQSPDGQFDLGVAHGVAGLLPLLAYAAAHDLDGARARRLLDGARRGLGAQALDGTYPAWVAPGVPSSPARLAWCYGDAGIAAASLASARAVGDEAAAAEALALARRAAARAAGDCRVTDASLCHGSAGLAHAFNRMYQASGDEALAAAARCWLEHALASRLRDCGVAGFRAAQPDGFRDDATLLEGAAGIGLAFTAAVSDEEPAWDRLLALSLPETT